VNPAHLEPVSLKENILRGTSVVAMNAQKDTCKRGHPFTEEGTVLNKDNSRRCRICKAEGDAKYHQKNRARNLASFKKRRELRRALGLK